MSPRLVALRGARVGLLGGSFNPAHKGHLHISLIALRRLGLREVWWLVSPQNPLKPAHGMASLDQRRATAEAVARHRRIRVTDIETRLGTRYTADTLPALKRRFPGVRFVWLMGADNLGQISAWQRWPEIFHTVPVAIFDRPFYAAQVYAARTHAFQALAGKAAIRFASWRLDARKAHRLAEQKPPAWVFFRNRLHPASATSIRAQAARNKTSKGAVPPLAQRGKTP